jgi:hypothetical protein
MPASNKARLWAILADLVCVLAFAAGGKSAHDESSTWWVILTIAWPYALAMLAGHLWAQQREFASWQPWPAGVGILGFTYAVGMGIRLATGRGVAVGFLIVAVIFLAVTMLGWRLVAGWVSRRRVRTTATR